MLPALPPPRWVRDAHPTAWLEGRAAAIRQRLQGTAVSSADACRACSANLFSHPKRAAWWAGYATLQAEHDGRERRERAEAEGADHA